MKQILNALGQPLEEVVRNDVTGEPIILSRQAQMVANYNQTIVNALGMEVNITTLTTIVQKVSQQKFFKIAFADFVPVRVGQGAWSSNLQTYRSFQISDDFGTGIMNQGANNARMATADAAVDILEILVFNWAKATGWSLIELQQAAKAGNWDLVTEREIARKTNWDLGLQKIAFLGQSGNSNILGLFNQAGITTNTTTLTDYIYKQNSSPSTLSTTIASFLQDYRANCNRTAWPTHFVVPELDFLGMAQYTSPTYPIKSILQSMQETFQTMTGNPGFKILPCAYADKAVNGSKNYYALLNFDERSIRMDIPVDYTPTIANSIDNFSFQNAAYGQFTGVLAYRPLELYYYTW